MLLTPVGPILGTSRTHCLITEINARNDPESQLFGRVGLLTQASFHSKDTKMGLVRNIISKAINLTSTKNIVLSIKTFFEFLTKNEYPIWLLVEVVEEVSSIASTPVRNGMR